MQNLTSRTVVCLQRGSHLLSILLLPSGCVLLLLSSLSTLVIAQLEGKSMSVWQSDMKLSLKMNKEGGKKKKKVFCRFSKLNLLTL